MTICLIYAPLFPWTISSHPLGGFWSNICKKLLISKDCCSCVFPFANVSPIVKNFSIYWKFCLIKISISICFFNFMRYSEVCFYFTTSIQCSFSNSFLIRLHFMKGECGLAILMKWYERHWDLPAGLIYVIILFRYFTYLLNKYIIFAYQVQDFM